MLGCWTRRALAAALLVLCGCGGPPAAYAPRFEARAPAAHEYSFAVHPLYNPQQLDRVYEPLVDTLNRRVPGAHFTLVASRDYANFENRLSQERFDFALPNPYQTLLAVKHHYAVFGKLGDDQRFQGLILVRRHGGVNALKDLEGAAISYPAPTAVEGTMMPQYFLATHGVPLARTRSLYVGSQDSSIESLYRGASRAAATWPPPWEAYQRAHPEVAAALEVKWRTPTLVNNGLVVHDTVPPEVARQVAAVLWSLPQTPEGRRILAGIGTSRFEPATEQTYAPVKAFFARYEAKVGPIRQTVANP